MLLDNYNNQWPMNVNNGHICTAFSDSSTDSNDKCYTAITGMQIILCLITLLLIFIFYNSTVNEDEAKTLWLDSQSHSSTSTSDEDFTWQWPTSFWTQFKVIKY